jgi:hypothetical protein
MTEIDAKTPELVLNGLPKDHVLRTFDRYRKVANVADAIRDHLRKYIQKNVPAGKYGDVVMAFKAAGEHVYANAKGTSALEGCVIVQPTTVNDEHAWTFGDEVTVRDRSGNILWRGLLVDNTTLYTKSETRNIVITDLATVATK